MALKKKIESDIYSYRDTRMPAKVEMLFGKNGKRLPSTNWHSVN
jgi:hypothetical protein